MFDGSKYPSSSTCTMELRLTIVHNSYEEFEVHMDEAMLFHGGFTST